MEQRLIQSPQMIQAMQILQLSGLDLLDRIQQELVENPFLEVEGEADDGKPRAEAPKEGGAEGAGGDVAAKAEPDDASVQGMIDELERIERDSWDGGRRRASDEEIDRKLEMMANTPELAKSLAEALMQELSFLDLDARSRRIAEYIAWSLDERGYLTQNLEELARECAQEERAERTGRTESQDPGAGGESAGAGSEGSMVGRESAEAVSEHPAEVGAEADPAAPAAVEPDAPVAEVSATDVAAVLEKVRSLSHPAIGARDIKECLLLQIDALGLENPLLRAIIENHLEDLEQNRLPRIAKSTGRPIEAVKQAVEVLRTLDPHPGAGYGESRAQVITPDVIVEETDGEYEIRLERQRIPRLVLSPAYREFLRQAKKGDGVKEWVRKRVESARWFIDAVQQRQSTLLRIAQAIFRRQKGFLERGVSGFKPLRMQEVADEVRVHISTVSRAVAGKYAQTPRGIFPLKYFFAGGTAKPSGEVTSQVSIKQRIADLVAGEEPGHPLSDDELAKLLEERDSVRIARRTVTKYRKALQIPSSNQRRRF